MSVAGYVLVVDDDPSVRSTAAEILAEEGHRVLEAADGEAALAVLADHPVTVLLLDVHMPRLDGLSLLERIDVPPPVVLLVSAYAFTADDRARVGGKVFRYLRKPVPPASLIAAVDDAMATAGS